MCRCALRIMDFRAWLITKYAPGFRGGSERKN
jgi:hypothetical protein